VKTLQRVMSKNISLFQSLTFSCLQFFCIDACNTDSESIIIQNRLPNM